MKHLAFSLIELMVVIAIVAILAAVAVPQYNMYLVKARLGGVVDNLSSIVSHNLAWGASNACGFPTTYSNPHYPGTNYPCYAPQANPYGCGFGSGGYGSAGINNICGGGGGYADDSIASRISPYFLPSTDGGGLYMGDYGANAPGEFGIVTMSLDTTKLGFNSDVASNAYINPGNGGAGFVITMWYWTINGVSSTFCDYTYGTSDGASGTAAILSGCTNANTTTGNDNNNENAAVWDNPLICTLTGSC